MQCIRIRTLASAAVASVPLPPLANALATARESVLPTAHGENAGWGFVWGDVWDSRISVNYACPNR